MGDLTKNISRWEMRCQCGCDFVAADIELIPVLQDVCDHFEGEKNLPKVTLTITSGNRCVIHNKKVGGSEQSKHIKGIAADFRIEEVHANKVADYLEKKYPNKYGIGRYNGRTHLDVRPVKARWDSR